MADGSRAGFPRTRIAAVAVVLVVLGWLGYMQHEYGQFRFWPSAAPPKLSFDGRNYREGSQPPVPAVGWFGSFGRIGHTLGGGEIWGTPDAEYARTVIWVHAGDGYHEYTLKGGP